MPGHFPALSADDLKRLCAEVARFSGKGDLQFKGLPVIAWEFASMAEFADTRAKVLRALTPEMILAGGHERVIGSEILEVDIYGVTFRLTCKQRFVHRQLGPMGAAEVR